MDSTATGWSGGAACQTAAAVTDLPAALLLRVLQQLPPNEVACTARLVCKEWAEACSSPQQRTVRLSRPLPPHAAGLVPYWEEGLPRLSFRDKLAALAAAAASGCETNLEVVWALMQPGQVPGIPRTYHMYAFSGTFPDPGTVAATHGHAHLLPWLMEHRCPIDLRCTLEAVAEHCDLAALRWAWSQLIRLLASDGAAPQGALAEAAGRSTTPDAQAKLEWLLTLADCRPRSSLAAGAAARGDLPRLQWLRERGVQPGVWALREALESPSAGEEVVEWLEQQPGVGSVAEAVQRGWRVRPALMEWVASLPYVEFEQRQWEEACQQAARAGDLPLVARLHEARGVALDGRVWCAAAESGSMELLSWLRDRGCPMGCAAYRAAALAGDLDLFAWLLREARCPLPRDPVTCAVTCWRLPGEVGRQHPGGAGADSDGKAAGGTGAVGGCGGGGGGDVGAAVRLLVGAGAVVEGSEALNDAARRGDLPLVQLLASLGGTWDSDTLVAAAGGGCEQVLRWLVARGCPLAGAREAYVAAGRNFDAATLRLLLALGVPCGKGGVKAMRQRCHAPVADALAAMVVERRHARAAAEGERRGARGADCCCVQ